MTTAELHPTNPLSPVASDVHATPRDSKYVLQGEGQEGDEDQHVSRPVRILRGVMYGVLALAALYLFLVSVKLIGESFMLMLGCNAKGAFDFADNPVAGIMVGVVTTALVQSSSTTTSITVALVGAGAMEVRQAVPVIMGANIGTCLTSLMVAFGQVADQEQFERAMAGATVHDMYNILTVVVMFPIEVLFHPLEKLALALSETDSKSGDFDSFVSLAVNPLAKAILAVDKDKINALAEGSIECQVGESLIKKGMFKDGSMSDTTVGVIVLLIGLVMLVVALLALVKMLSKLFLGATQRAVSKVLNYNGYINIVVGAVVTFIVQSSSITTSTLTPLAGLGVVTLEQVYPLVLGANLGTTTTALLASMATGNPDAVAIALVHFFFNVCGITLFYPIPVMRRPVLHMARSLAYFSSCWTMCALFFIALVFVVCPGVLLALVSLCTSSSTGAMVVGWILLGLLIVAAAGFWYWYMKKGGRQQWFSFLERKREESNAKKETAAASAGSESHESTTGDEAV